MMNRRSSPDLERAVSLIAERGGSLGKPLHIVAETTSTNDDAKDAARSGAPHGSTWVAESQTAGRGRQGRAWVSPRGENLLMSVLWRMPCPVERLPLLSLAAGIAVCEVARASLPKAVATEVMLKWPNDVVHVSTSKGEPRFEKLAGILVESSMTGRKVDGVVIGIGINVLTRDFPPELLIPATSFALLANQPVDRAEILADVLVALDRTTSAVAARGLGLLHDKLDGWNALRGHPVRNEAGSGVAVAIDAEGRLVVDTAEGRQAWAAGEVHLALGA